MNKNIILILVFLLGITLVFFELIIPIYSATTAINLEIQQKQKDLSEARIIAEKINALTEKYNAMSEEITQIDNLVPNKESLPEIIASLDAVASENGIVLESINFQSKKSISEDLTMIETPLSYNSLGIQISSSASNYNGLKSFLGAVEKNLRLMDTDKVSFSASTEKTGEFKLDINLIAYYK